MSFSKILPTKPGTYNHRWSNMRGDVMSQTLFVGWVDPQADKNQGTIRPTYAVNMKCCRPEQHLHADRLTPLEWGGEWEAPPNAQNHQLAS